MKKLLLLTGICIFAMACQEKPIQKPLKDYSAVADSLSAQLKIANTNDELVGYAAALITTDSILYADGFGYADVHNDRLYTENSVQNIGSIAKTILGVSVLKAQELGALKLSDPINKHLPFEVINPSFPDIPITIQQLVTHTSSVIDDEENYLRAFIYEYDSIPKHETYFTHFKKRSERISLGNFLEKCISTDGEWYTTAMFSENEPGATFQYSNFGADLCGFIIENATGMAYKDFASKHVLNPLGMNDSGWDIKDLDPEKRAKFYLLKGQQITDYTAITYPNGGLFTSATDLSKFLAELMKGYQGEGTLLTKAGYEQFYKKNFKAPIEDPGRVNMGVFVGYNNFFIDVKADLIGHNGSDIGSLAMMYFNPETMIGKVLTINTDIDYNDEAVIPNIKAIWKALADYENKFSE